MDVSKLKAVIESDSKPAEEGMSRFHGLLQKATGAMGGLAGGLGILAGGAVIGGIALISSQLGGMIKDGEDANAVIAQTNAVLKSTHGAAGMSATAVSDLATHLMNLTGIDDDTVQSAENMLLTFTNIGKKGGVFDQATKTTLDMSVALGQDTKSSAIQLGKALNDPIHGITALQRVGVTFDAQQKQLIQTYMAHGQTAKAQAVILGELNKEFGGSAEAAGQANGGIKILEAQFGNIKETIGQAVIPILGKLFDKITPLIQQFAQWLPGALDKTGKFIDTNIMPIVDKLGTWFMTQGVPALQKFGGFIMTNVVPALQRMFVWFNDNVVPILMTLWGVIINNVVPAFLNIWQHISEKLIPALQRLWEKLEPVLKPALEAIGWVLQNVLGPAIGDIIDLIGWLIDRLSDALGWLEAVFGVKSPMHSKGDNGIKVHGPDGQTKSFASGTDNAPGGLALVGEGGEPEIVAGPHLMNLPRGSSVTPLSKLGGFGNTTINNYNIYPAKAQFGPAELDLLMRRRALLANTGGGY